jgi:DNA-binding response OmpR family regulator
MYNTNHMKLLIIEDDIKIATALKKGLGQERFAVDLVHTGPSGLASALEDDYDLIVVDRMLPGGLDGLTVTQELRRKSKTMPVLMLTAKDRINDRVDGLNAGADDYLVKPFAFEELLARVRALLRRPSDQFIDCLAYDTLTLDPQTYEVKRGTTLIQLSKREFSLLEYLMRNADRTVAKETIMNHVWDFDADILPNTVEVYIGYLRKKIDNPFPGQKALIHTIRGFGYKLGSA